MNIYDFVIFIQTYIGVVRGIYGLERVAEHVLQLLIAFLVHVLAHDHSAVDYIAPCIEQHLTLVKCRKRVQ